MADDPIPLPLNDPDTKFFLRSRRVLSSLSAAVALYYTASGAANADQVAQTAQLLYAAGTGIVAVVLYWWHVVRPDPRALHAVPKVGGAAPAVLLALLLPAAGSWLACAGAPKDASQTLYLETQAYNAAMAGAAAYASEPQADPLVVAKLQLASESAYAALKDGNAKLAAGDLTGADLASDQVTEAVALINQTLAAWAAEKQAQAAAKAQKPPKAAKPATPAPAPAAPKKETP